MGISKKKEMPDGILSKNDHPIEPRVDVQKIMEDLHQQIQLEQQRLACPSTEEYMLSDDTLDVAAIMRKINWKVRRLMGEEEPASVNKQSWDSTEARRILHYINGERASMEQYTEPGRFISVSDRWMGPFRWLVCMIKRFFRKATRFLMLDQMQYNQAANNSMRAMGELCLLLQREIEKLATRNEKLVQQNHNMTQCTQELIKQNKDLAAQKDALLASHLELEQQVEHIVEALQEVREKESLPTDDPDFYERFEERFRGSQDDIKGRLQMYIPILKQYLPNWASGTFVDIGSGRGEWLDILKENNATDYLGVDLNPRQNKKCELRGHHVLQMDCLTYLESLPDASVDVITGFQIIEHLSTALLTKLMEQSFRVLKPGGVVLLETQNPKNISVGADTFFIDPSHKRVVQPLTLEFLAQYQGFENVQLIDANTSPLFIKFDTNVMEGMNEKFIQYVNDIGWKLFGPQDYALLAVKGLCPEASPRG